MQNYVDTLGSKELMRQVSAGRAGKDRFFRSYTKVDPNSIDVYFYEDNTENTFHLVSPEVANVLGGLARKVTLHMAVDRTNAPSFIPTPFTDANSQRNSSS